MRHVHRSSRSTWSVEAQPAVKSGSQPSLLLMSVSRPEVSRGKLNQRIPCFFSTAGAPGESSSTSILLRTKICTASNWEDPSGTVVETWRSGCLADSSSRYESGAPTTKTQLFGENCSFSNTSLLSCITTQLAFQTFGNRNKYK